MSLEINERYAGKLRRVDEIVFGQEGGTHPTTAAANPSTFLEDQAIDNLALQMWLQDFR